MDISFRPLSLEWFTIDFPIFYVQSGVIVLQNCPLDLYYHMMCSCVRLDMLIPSL